MTAKLEPPSWINESFVEKALRQAFNNNELRVKDLDVKPAVSTGDNYSSIMLRCNFVLEKTPGNGEKFSIIVKALPDGIVGEELGKFAFFEREQHAYLKVLPAIDRILKKAYPQQEKLFPQCYYLQTSPNNTLVFEDLRQSGYVLANRQEGLDLDHALLVIRSLAKFHAASVVLLRDEPEITGPLDSPVWQADTSDSLKVFFQLPFKIFSKEILTWTDFESRETFSQKLEKMEEVVMSKLSQIWERDESRMNVILHGDSWVCNFLFKYDPVGKLSGMNFVDLQLISRNSPALDLQYFMFTSLRPEIKFNPDVIDQLLQVYHETFQETLNALDYHPKEPYTFDQLKKDFEDKHGWGFISLCVVFPLTSLPSKDYVEPEEFFNTGNSSSFERVFKREGLKEVFKNGFRYFDEKGAIE